MGKKAFGVSLGGDHSAQRSSLVFSSGRRAGLMCECGLLFVSRGL